MSPLFVILEHLKSCLFDKWEIGDDDSFSTGVRTLAPLSLFICFGKKSSDVYPRSFIIKLVILDLLERILNFLLNSLFSEFLGMVHQEVPVAPSGVVHRIILDHFLDELHLFIEEVEVLDEPNPVAPSVIIFVITLKDSLHKLFLIRRIIELLDNTSSMMPDLVVLLKSDTNFIKIFDFILPVFLSSNLIEALPTDIPSCIATIVDLDNHLG
mmetsp:Transcript_26165/g.26037  ORF Transcript_26165/g.26037 Transcript_26165/m.26037 type:complete len:212 (-) Transcript_26165:79-714(-)